MTIQIIETEFVRTIQDDLNPRIYSREFKCAECKEWIDEDEVVWIDPITKKASVEKGNAYCVSCAPPEEGEEL